jgi:hypothetical protein
LPEPFGPIRPSRSPVEMPSVMLLKSGRAPKLFEIARTLMRVAMRLVYLARRLTFRVRSYVRSGCVGSVTVTVVPCPSRLANSIVP